MKLGWFFAAVMLLLAAWPAQGEEVAAAFSALRPGQALPSPFRVIGYPKIKPNTNLLVSDAGMTVLQMNSQHSASNVAIPVSVVPQKTPLLTWRWRVSNVLEAADMTQKLKDDFSARVYVFFDVPLESLSFADRNKIRLARMVAGPDVPTAALCYVWGNKHAVGYFHVSPFTNRIHRVVLQSGAQNVGKWVSETRDVAVDFRHAFGAEPPRITGVAVGNDSDQTDAAVMAWFGDLFFSGKT